MSGGSDVAAGSEGGPLFSAVIPTFDRSSYLVEAVESVLAQTIDDLECIVVDDASPQPVAWSGDPRVRVLRLDTNSGPAAARNHGVIEARGRYLAFLDDDDVWLPNRLELALQGLERAPVAICWRAELGDPALRPAGRRLEGWVHDVILDDLTPHLGETALDRKCWQPFDERYAGSEDVEWWLRITRSCPVATVERVGQLWRRHPGERARHGAAARISGSLRLLEEQDEYFSSHRRARAMRWKRVGLTALATGDRSLARSAFRRSLTSSPSLRTLKHLALATTKRR